MRIPGALVFLLLLLSGCGAPTPTSGSLDPSPALVHYDVPAAVAVLAQDASSVCPANLGCIKGGTDLLRLLGNQTATGFRFDVSPLASIFGTPAENVHVEIRCSGATACKDVLAQGDGAKAFVLASNATLPPGTSLHVVATTKSTAPDPDGLAATQVAVDGIVHIEAPLAPAPALASTAVHETGTTGPCVPLAECGSGPGFVQTLGQFPGAVHTVDLWLNWTAQTELSRALNLTFSSCAGSCTPTQYRMGPSPLHLRLDPVRYPAGSTLQVTVSEGRPGVTVLNSRQSFVLEGSILSEAQSG